jgi:YHS domain-containing protein
MAGQQPSRVVARDSFYHAALAQLRRADDMPATSCDEYILRRFMMVRDPVCGMLLDPAYALRLEYHNLPYYFCTHDCKLNFEDRPDEYAKPNATTVVGHSITHPSEVVASAIRGGATDH